MLFQFLKKVSFFLELIYKFYFFSASHSTPTSPLVLLSSQTILLHVISIRTILEPLLSQIFIPLGLESYTVQVRYCEPACRGYLQGIALNLHLLFVRIMFCYLFYVPLLDNIVCECDRSGHTVSSILLILSPWCYRSRLSCRLCQINFDSENTEEQKGVLIRDLR